MNEDKPSLFLDCGLRHKSMKYDEFLINSKDIKAPSANFNINKLKVATSYSKHFMHFKMRWR